MGFEELMRKLAALIGLAPPQVAVKREETRRARGGSVSKATLYMIGRDGPELFVPKTTGKIVHHERDRS